MNDKNYSRMSRINELIKRELANIFSKESQDPRFKFVTITEVDTSPDLAVAKIYFCSMTKKSVKDVVASLNKAAGFFRKELAKKVDLRNTPRLEFVYDSSTYEGSKINDILFSINQNKEDNSDES